MARIRPMTTTRNFKPLVDTILDGWYHPPIEKFHDGGIRFYDEAEALLESFVRNLRDDIIAQMEDQRKGKLI